MYAVDELPFAGSVALDEPPIGATDIFLMTHGVDYMPKPRHFVALLVLVLMAGCASRNLNVAFDSHYDFAGPRTYDWAPKEPETGPELSYDVIDRAVKNAVDARMREAGYTLTSDQPAYRLIYYVGVEEVGEITDDSYYGPGWAAHWAYGWDGPAGLNMSQYDRGTITLDVLSTQPGMGLVWRGLAYPEISPAMSPNRLEGAVRSALGDILNDFPPETDR